MTILFRPLALVALAACAWVVVAGQMSDRARLPMAAVVPGAVVTQRFGCTPVALEPFDPYCPTRRFHSGVDLAAPAGTEVRSATGGVAHIGIDPAAAGLYVAVAYDSHVRVLYCHLSAFRVVDGEKITAGQLIGLVGATGLATGPHVHFEVDVDGIAVDPGRWLEA